MSENTQTETTNNDQSYIRLVRYLRKQQEENRDEAPDTKETNSNKSE